MKEGNIDKQGQIDGFKEKIAGLKEENEDKQVQIDRLLSTIEEMKKKLLIILKSKLKYWALM